MQSVEFDLLDKPRRLRYSLEDTLLVDELLAPSGFGLYYAIKHMQGPRLIIMLLYAGLKWSDQRLTLNYVKKKVAKILKQDPKRFVDIQEEVMAAVMQADIFAGVDEDEEDQENPTEEDPQNTKLGDSESTPEDLSSSD